MAADFVKHVWKSCKMARGGLEDSFCYFDLVARFWRVFQHSAVGEFLTSDPFSGRNLSLSSAHSLSSGGLAPISPSVLWARQSTCRTNCWRHLMSQQPISCPHENARFLLVSFFFLVGLFICILPKSFCYPLVGVFFYIIFVGGTHGCMLIQAKKETNRETNNRHKSLNCQQLLNRVIMSKSTLRVERQAPVATEFFFFAFFSSLFLRRKRKFSIAQKCTFKWCLFVATFFCKGEKVGTELNWVFMGVCKNG